MIPKSVRAAFVVRGADIRRTPYQANMTRFGRGTGEKLRDLTNPGYPLLCLSVLDVNQ